MTRRETEALDNAKRVLVKAESAAGTGAAEKLIQVVDRWLAIADRERR